MVMPYYLTPLLGAWPGAVGSPESVSACAGHLMDEYGIAWVMALFEGSVAFVMIAALMFPLEGHRESSGQAAFARSRVRLPLVIPGILGAAIFVFAEMLGSCRRASVAAQPLLRHHHGELPR